MPQEGQLGHTLHIITVCIDADGSKPLAIFGGRIILTSYFRVPNGTRVLTYNHMCVLLDVDTRNAAADVCFDLNGAMALIKKYIDVEVS